MRKEIETIEELIECGLSPAEAIDYYKVEIEGLTATEWAEVRGTSRQNISRNKREAERKLSPVLDSIDALN